MNLYLNSSIGILEVVTGSMFSGKSEELIRRLRRSQYAKQKVIVFKHLDCGHGYNILFWVKKKKKIMI